MLISVRSASLWWSEIITDFFIWSFPSGTANSGLPAKNVGVLHAAYLSRNYICSILRSIRDQRLPEVTAPSIFLTYDHGGGESSPSWQRAKDLKHLETDAPTASLRSLVSMSLEREVKPAELQADGSELPTLTNTPLCSSTLIFILIDRNWSKKINLIVFMHCFCNWCISTGSRFHICNIYLT